MAESSEPNVVSHIKTIVLRRVFLFNVDGVLCNQDSFMFDDIVSDFLNKMNNEPYYLVTNKTFDRLSTQIPNDVIKKAEGIFTNLGNQVWLQSAKRGTYLDSDMADETCNKSQVLDYFRNNNVNVGRIIYFGSDQDTSDSELLDKLNLENVTRPSYNGIITVKDPADMIEKLYKMDI